MRLIDADALENEYRKQFESVFKNIRDSVNPSDFYIERKAAYDKELMRLEMEAFCEFLQSRPTIEAEPVRHGKWIWIFNRPVERFPGEKCYESGWECSECCAASTMTIGFGCEKPGYENFLKEMNDERTKYCPECGAKMDLEG